MANENKTVEVHEYFGNISGYFSRQISKKNWSIDSVESLEPKGNINQALQAACTAEVWTLLLVIIP